MGRSAPSDKSEPRRTGYGLDSVRGLSPDVGSNSQCGILGANLNRKERFYFGRNMGTRDLIILRKSDTGRKRLVVSLLSGARII